MKIYFVRHGETEWNALGKWQGSTDVSLNDAGREQARNAADLLTRKGVGDAAVYSSDLIRAKETAGIIASVINGDDRVDADSGLREINCGEWEGLTHDVITAYPCFDEWEAGGMNAPGGGESKRQVHDRVVAAVRNIAQSEGERDIVIVSHSLAIRMFVCHTLKTDIGDWDTFNIDNASVTTAAYRRDRDRFRIITLNERYFN